MILILNFLGLNVVNVLLFNNNLFETLAVYCLGSRMYNFM